MKCTMQYCKNEATHTLQFIMDDREEPTEVLEYCKDHVYDISFNCLGPGIKVLVNDLCEQDHEL